MQSRFGIDVVVGAWGDIEILRRGYFTDASDGFGRLEAGLICVQPRHSIRLDAGAAGKHGRAQRVHGTAVFACPPGQREGDSSAHWGSMLFG